MTLVYFGTRVFSGSDALLSSYTDCSPWLYYWLTCSSSFVLVSLVHTLVCVHVMKLSFPNQWYWKPGLEGCQGESNWYETTERTKNMLERPSIYQYCWNKQALSSIKSIPLLNIEEKSYLRTHKCWGEQQTEWLLKNPTLKQRSFHSIRQKDSCFLLGDDSLRFVREKHGTLICDITLWHKNL